MVTHRISMESTTRGFTHKEKKFFSFNSVDYVMCVCHKLPPQTRGCLFGFFFFQFTYFLAKPGNTSSNY